MQTQLSRLVCAGLLALGASGSAHALTALSLDQGCDWIQAEQSAHGDTGLPDEGAKYYIAFMPTNPPAGASVVVEGRYPQIRFFGFTLYQNLGRPVDWLSDSDLLPDEGGGRPDDRANVPYSNGYLNHYTLRVKFEDAPAVRADNVLYTGAYTTPTNSILLIRYYGPHPGADGIGNAPLPSLSYVAPDGTRTPLADNDNPRQCKLLKTLLPLPFIASPPVVGIALPHPEFKIISYNSKLSTAPYPNPVSGYARALTDLARDDMVIVRYKRPITPVSPDAVDPDALPGPAVVTSDGGTDDAQVRYMSVCQTTLQFTTTVDCANDQQLIVQDDGYVNIVIAPQRPAAATAAAGYNYLAWGSYPQALVLIRQILAESGFAGDYQTASLAKDAATALGDWYPQITYCDEDTYNTMVRYGGAVVFDACKTAYEAAPLAHYKLFR